MFVTITDFSGLSAMEIIFGRFAPLAVLGGLPWTLLMLLGLSDSPSELVRLTRFFSALLIGAVVWIDARRARLQAPLAWATVGGLVPLLGWVVYGRARSRRTPEASFSSSPSRALAGDAEGNGSSVGGGFLRRVGRSQTLLLSSLSPATCAQESSGV